MKETEHNLIGEGKEEQLDLTPINVIRTETVLSRLPIHNLAKAGRVNIQIIRKTKKGEIDLRWEVSYSDRYGQPRQLAYKLDTIVVNRRIDEEGRPLPKMIRIGSLREIANALGLGGDTNSVRKALRQNASAFITAKFKYTSNDHTERSVEADFTRYSVIFTGEKLPDGQKADAVYIILNEPYREVVNNSPVRPLDYDYLKELPPVAQRFYEIVSRKMFSALKNGHPHATLSYSEFCTFSAQQMQIDYDHFKKQMYKVHRPHLKSGYITKIQYEASTDEEGRRDWLMLYTPGPKAQAEFQTFNGLPIKIRRTRQRKISAASRSEGIEVKQLSNEEHHHPRQVQPAEKGIEGDAKLLSELTDRRIFESVARKLLATLQPEQLERVADYCDYWDTIPADKKTPGLLHSLIQNNDPLPSTFETRRQRAERLAVSDRRRKQILVKDTLTDRYEEYRSAVIDRFIAEQLPLGELDRRVAIQKAKDSQQQGLWNSQTRPELAENMARHAVRNQIAEQITFQPYEEFRKAELPKILAELQITAAELGIE